MAGDGDRTERHDFGGQGNERDGRDHGCDRERRAADAAPGVRVRGVPRRAGSDRRPCGGGPGRRRAHADRWRKVALLPDPGPGQSRYRHRHLTPDRPDAGPGGRAAGARCAGRLHQLHAGFRRAPLDGGPVRRRRARPALSGPGAAPPGHHARPALPWRDLRLRDRRGALRRPVGPRLPPGLSGPLRPRRALARRTAHRPDGHRDQRHAPGDHTAPGHARREALRRQLRPAQHPVPDRAEGRP